MINDEIFLKHALKLAVHAETLGEVPVGAVLVQDNQIIAEGWNCPITSHDPTGHAEMIAIRAAAQKLQNYRLPNTTLYVTLEPCLMCVGAILHARIERLVFGALDPRAGAVVSVTHALDLPIPHPKIIYEYGLLAQECGNILSAFFAKKRSNIASKRSKE